MPVLLVMLSDRIFQDLRFRSRTKPKQGEVSSSVNDPHCSCLHICRLHVNIFDTDDKQFTIPESVIARPAAPLTSFTRTSDLVFNYDSSPFAFWISRRSDPHAAPLFDTRLTSLPQTPIPSSSSDQSTALDGFPLVFEDQYLQVSLSSLLNLLDGLSHISPYVQLTSALPLGANIYGLGEVVSSSGFRRAVGTDGDNGTIQTLWARDIADPIDQNV